MQALSSAKATCHHPPQSPAKAWQGQPRVTGLNGVGWGTKKDPAQSRRGNQTVCQAGQITELKKQS